LSKCVEGLPEALEEEISLYLWEGVRGGWDWEMQVGYIKGWKRRRRGAEERLEIARHLYYRDL
jgi:hypothetical protein